jgi:hypothetical protein
LFGNPTEPFSPAFFTWEYGQILVACTMI